MIIAVVNHCPLHTFYLERNFCQIHLKKILLTHYVQNISKFCKFENFSKFEGRWFVIVGLYEKQQIL